MAARSTHAATARAASPPILWRRAGPRALDLETQAGLLHCRAAGENRVVVDMGKPNLDWQEIPLAERMDTRKIDVKVGPIDAPVLFGPSAVNMGNPHCIFFVDNVDAYDLARLGPMIEHHPMFPERANISLAQVRGPDAIRLRVWERGAGLTQACGTAACAVVVAASPPRTGQPARGRHARRRHAVDRMARKR